MPGTSQSPALENETTLTPSQAKKAQRKEARKDLSRMQEWGVLTLGTFGVGGFTAAALNVPDQIMTVTNSSKPGVTVRKIKYSGSFRGYAFAASFWQACISFRKTLFSATLASSNKVGAKRVNEFSREAIETRDLPEHVRENEQASENISTGMQVVMTTGLTGGFAVVESIVTGKTSANLIHKRVKEHNPEHVIPDMKHRSLQEKVDYRFAAFKTRTAKNFGQTFLFPVQAFLEKAALNKFGCSDYAALTGSAVIAGILTGPITNVGSKILQIQLENQNSKTLKVPGGIEVLKNEIARKGTTAFLKENFFGAVGRRASAYAGVAAFIVPKIEEAVEDTLDKTIVPWMSRNTSEKKASPGNVSGTLFSNHSLSHSKQESVPNLAEPQSSSTTNDDAHDKDRFDPLWMNPFC